MKVYIVLSEIRDRYGDLLLDEIVKVFWTEEIANQFCSWNENCYYEEWEVSDEQ